MANQPQQPDTALHNASHLMQYHDLIESIVAALDARDAYTASHSDRVADMVLVLAAALGLDEDETTRIHMAAHLHDSVLQTLALIQRQASDPRAVVQLARRQERELRAWLYGETSDESTVKAALVAAAAEVEDDHGLDVDIVVVGDRDLDAGLRALVQAAREAMVNAAKHAHVGRIDVYAEMDDGSVEVFVRDRGRGFNLDEVGEDRMGVRGSIVERLRRAGGNATIRSAPTEGTEVRLEMKR